VNHGIGQRLVQRDLDVGFASIFPSKLNFETNRLTSSTEAEMAATPARKRTFFCVVGRETGKFSACFG
jgi:hypothetical protein